MQLGFYRTSAFTLMLFFTALSMTGACTTNTPNESNKEVSREMVQDGSQGKETVPEGIQKNQPCKPNGKKCATGLVCCATCCGHDAGPDMDPAYRCVKPENNGTGLGCPMIP